MTTQLLCIDFYSDPITRYILRGVAIRILRERYVCYLRNNFHFFTVILFSGDAFWCRRIWATVRVGLMMARL